MNILLAKSPSRTAAALVRRLNEDCYCVDWARDGQSAVSALTGGPKSYQAALIDWELPLLPGLDVLRAVRRAGNDLPIMMVLDGDALDLRIGALNEGADILLSNPLEIRELEARLRALARRCAGRADPQIRTTSLSLDPATRSVVCDGERVQLTARECTLLHALMRSPGELCSRAELELRVYGRSGAVESNALEFLLHSLRRKIGCHQIENRRGRGWRVPD